MGKKLKNKELASMLGVSDTLISLVLNNKADQYGIRKDTQEKVLELARKAGFFDSYNENELISSIVEKPGIIGLIVTSVDDSFVIQILKYLQQAFLNIGVGFSVVVKDQDNLRFDRFLKTYKKLFSGIILLSDAADDITIRTLKSAKYPFVLLEKTERALRLNTVCTDSVVGANLICDHIEKIGYKNIIIVSDNTGKKEFKDLANALGLKPSFNKHVVIELGTEITGGKFDFAQFNAFFHPPYRAEVIIVTNSQHIYPLMNMLREKKLRVPQDIAVISMEEGIGFDISYSPVTSLRKPFQDLALKSVNMIWSEVKNSGQGKFKRQVKLSPELIIRKSCGSI
jgi:LacI family transcriptional regulator, galactose operon repressor